MNKHQPQQNNKLGRAIRKLSLSAFVIFSFTAYVMHKPFSNADPKLGALPPAANVLPTQPEATPTAPNATSTAAQPDIPPTASPPPPTDIPAILTDTPAAPTAAAQVYKDGTYTGPEVDAYYGLVQVQTVIQNGKIANVQFLEYPNDRRTSVRINSYAVPYLQQEALQAQSANVDIITGATLTSQAFQLSLQAALGKAGG